MLSQTTYQGSTILLLLVIVVAAYTDIRRHRIPNWLSLGALGMGLLLSYLYLPDSHLHEGLKGAGVGLAMLLPLYLLGGMGAGDVKLMAAIGSFVGPEVVLISVGFALITGGVIATLIVLRNGEFSHLYRRYLVMISARTLMPAEEGSIAKRRFPYALSIAIGTLIALGLYGQLEFTQLGAWIGSQLQVPGGTQ